MNNIFLVSTSSKILVFASFSVLAINFILGLIFLIIKIKHRYYKKVSIGYIIYFILSTLFFLAGSVVFINLINIISDEDNCIIKSLDKPVISIHSNNLDLQINLTTNANLFIYPETTKENNTYIWNTKIENNFIIIDNKLYPYIFWENYQNTKDYRIDKGYCIKGSETISFLEDKLTYLGLDYKEKTDFITYWTPKMINNNYNIISFIGLDSNDEYNQDYQLTNSLNLPTQRVIMIWQNSDTYIEIQPQELLEFTLKDDYILEWGGIEYNE